jgi:glycosyltransferase involved in cell wall biosynthesis
MKKRSRILIVEPYFGGSHQHFLKGVMRNVDADYSLLTLPARRWKMRMQISAPWFAEQICDMAPAERSFDTVLCSTFVDVAVLRALLLQITGWNPATCFCTYFHENQFAYPGRISDPASHQFMAINFNSALASDRLAFNSHYNMNSFIQGCRLYVNKAADMSVQATYSGIVKKSIVLHPGMEYAHIDSAPAHMRGDVPVIVWNHRWEHDKNPEEFFTALQELKEKGIPFKLMLLGQSFSTEPECFSTAKVTMAEHLIHYGYAESMEEYGMLLKKGDIVVSTAIHEFFGISVLEAVRAGCTPLLPEKLSYPELYPEEYLYPEGELAEYLERLLLADFRLSGEKCLELTERHSWAVQAEKYQKWLLQWA